MKMKPGCGDMGGMKGQEVGSCQQRCPLCPCFQVGSGQGLNHLQLPAGAPRTAGCPGLEHLFLAVGKGCSRTTGGSPSDARGDGGQWGLACRLRRDRVGQPPPQEWGAPRELPAHVSSCLCWLSLPGAEPTLVLTSSFAVLAACWVTALLPCRAGSGVPGGCVLTTPPSAFPCLGTHEVAAIFPLRSKSLHFQPVLAVRVGGAVRGEGGLGAAGALGKTGAEGPYEMQGKAAGRPDPLLSTRL